MRRSPRSTVFAALLVTGCFEEAPPIDDAAAADAGSDAGAPDDAEADEATADESEGSSDGGSDDGDADDGDADDDSDDGADDDDDDAGTTGGRACQDVEAVVPATPVAADVVLAIDDALGAAARAEIDAALASVAAQWQANDVHVALVAPADVAPPWEDGCATSVQLPVAPGEPRHPLVLLADHHVAGDLDCALRPAGTASRHYAVVSGRDPAVPDAAQFNDLLFEDQQAEADARFHAGHAVECGEGGATLTDLAAFGCGTAVDVCVPDAALSWLQTLGTPRAACDYAPSIPPGHSLEGLVLEVEIPSLGATLDMDRVDGPGGCTEIVDPGNLPRQWYAQDGRVHLCQGACCLAQSAVVEDLRLHEQWTCAEP